MTANMIGTVIIQIVIGIILIVRCYLYFGKKGEAGEAVRNISTPLKCNVIKVAVYAVIFLLWFYARVLVIEADYTKMDLVYAAVLLGELIVAIILDNLPQQICENGIVTHRGYRAWTEIQSVEENENPEVIQLKIEEKAGFMQQIFCVEDEKKAIEEYVAEHMNYIPDVNEQAEIEMIEEAGVEVEAETKIVVEASVEAETGMEVAEESPQEISSETEAETAEEAVVESIEENFEVELAEVVAETDKVAGKICEIENDDKNIVENAAEEEMEYDQISEWHEESDIEESTDEKEE